MDFGQGKIVPVNLEHEMKNSYIDYAMSVIVARALPDVRPGRLETSTPPHPLRDAGGGHGLEQALQEIGPYRR